MTAIALMVMLCMIWGLQQTSMKFVADQVDPILQIGVRSCIAALLVLIFSRVIRRDRWLSGLFPGPALLAGSLFALEFLLVAEGLRWTTASHMAVFLYTAPIFAAIGLHLAQPDERMSPVQWVGVAVTFTGVASVFLLPELRGTGMTLTPGMIIGDLLGLAAGFSWGMTTVVIRTTRMADAPPAQTLFYQLTIAGAAATAFCILAGRMVVQSSPQVWLSLSFQTVIICSLSFLIWFRMLQVYRSSRLGVLSFMTPLFGVAAGAVLLGETLTPEFLFGGFLVLLGMVITQTHEWISARRTARAGAQVAS